MKRFQLLTLFCKTLSDIWPDSKTWEKLTDKVQTKFAMVRRDEK